MRQWFLTYLFKSITRFEVIDETGRAYTKWGYLINFEPSLQDNGRTLKVFISHE